MKNIIRATAVILEVICCVCIFMLVAYEVLINVRINGCKMTWMYEYPKYLKVTLPVSVQKKFPKYSLFIYGEGEYASHLMSMNGNYKLNGIPVVFIHGNAGRYKQVRSPASVSLRKSEQAPYVFNYFSVDYEEELSALYGPFLQQQTKFLYHCIKRILRCYKSNHKPSSVIAIGHSMGGLVIRGLYLLPEFSPNLVNVIVTLASPHLEPPVKLDSEITNYYTNVNRYWQKHSTTLLANVTLLSLGGSFRDYLVRSDLCDLSGISGNQYHMSTITTSVPRIWLAADHQCIVWCNELVRAITRMFFQIVDDRTKQITQDHKVRFDVASKIFFNKHVVVNTLETPSTCESIQLKNTVSFLEVKSHTCFYINIDTTFQEEDTVHIWVHTLNEFWVYTCEMEDCKMLSSASDRVLPSEGDRFSRYVALKNDWKLKTVVIFLNKNDKFYAQKHKTCDHSLEVPSIQPTFQTVSSLTFFTNIVLKSFTESWQVFEVTLSDDSTNEQVVMMHVPWSQEVYNFTYKNNRRVFKLKVFAEKPFAKRYKNEHIQLSIWRENISTMQVHVLPLFSESLGQLFRFNVESILRYSLVFGVMRLLLLFIKSLHSKTLVAFPTTVYETMMLVVMVLVSKVTTWMLVKSTDWNVVVPRVVFPQTVLILLSLLLADVTHIVLKMLFTLCQLVLYPVSICSHAFQCIPNCPPMGRIGLFILLSALIPILDGKFPIAVVLVLFLLLHIIKINSIENTKRKIFHKNVLLLVTPTLIVFSATPIIVYVKDIMDSFPHQYKSFTNLQVLCGAYCCYLCICCFGDRDTVLFETPGGSVVVTMTLLLVGSFFCLFPEFVVLYNLTYLVCSVLFGFVFLSSVW